jgi:hypothetical protein
LVDTHCIEFDGIKSMSGGAEKFLSSPRIKILQAAQDLQSAAIVLVQLLISEFYEKYLKRNFGKHLPN